MSETMNLSGLQERIIDSAARSHPSLARGQVWCRACGLTRKVDASVAMRLGWPKHCGYTMTIDSPEEQASQPQGSGESGE